MISVRQEHVFYMDSALELAVRQWFSNPGAGPHGAKPQSCHLLAEGGWWQGAGVLAYLLGSAAGSHPLASHSEETRGTQWPRLVLPQVGR